MKKYLGSISISALVILCSVVIAIKSNMSFGKSNNTLTNKSYDNSSNSDDVSKVILHSDYPFYNTVNELKEASDIIVECTPVDYEVNTINLGSELKTAQTTFSVNIDNVFKGNINPNTSLLINQIGGELNGITYSEDDAALLNIDTKYVLFLRTFDDIPELNNQPASIISPIQGIYLVDSNGSYNSVNSQNTLDISYDDLI